MSEFTLVRTQILAPRLQNPAHAAGQHVFHDKNSRNTLLFSVSRSDDLLSQNKKKKKERVKQSEWNKQTFITKFSLVS